MVELQSFNTLIDLSKFSWGLCPLLPRGKKGIGLSRLPNPFPHCLIHLRVVLRPLVGQIWRAGVHQPVLFYA
jgi:hypothetical protein